jgi:hypothetical protein
MNIIVNNVIDINLYINYQIIKIFINFLLTASVVLASSVVDPGFEPWSGQTKE